MTTVISERADSGDAALPVIAGAIAAVAVALFAYGAITVAPPSHSADLSITVPPSLAPDSAPSAPSPN
jgi:hypothetical protein